MKRLVIYSAIALGLVAAASGEISLRQIELAERGPVGDAMQRVAAFQMKAFGDHAPTDWKTGTFFSGVVAAYEATGNSNYLDYATAWSESAQWKIPDHPLHADQLCTGQTYLDLFFGKRDPAMIADLKFQMERGATFRNRCWLHLCESGSVIRRDESHLQLLPGDQF